MRVTHLSLGDFRNYRSAEVVFRPGLNLVIGRNGQGKTNLVEAIGYFSTLGSHRTTGDSALIRAGCDSAVMRMRVAVAEREVLLEVQLNKDRRNRAQLNRNGVTPRELTRWFSSVLFAPEDLLLVRGDPSVRRRFLDEAVVARQPSFAAVLSDYERVVRQRTALLKSARGGGNRSALEATLDVWDARLVELGTSIMLARRSLVRDLVAPVQSAYAAIVQQDHRPRISLSESVSAEILDQDVSRETSDPVPDDPRTAVSGSSGELEQSGEEKEESKPFESRPSIPGGDRASSRGEQVPLMDQTEAIIVSSDVELHSSSDQRPAEPVPLPEGIEDSEEHPESRGSSNLRSVPFASEASVSRIDAVESGPLHVSRETPALRESSGDRGFGSTTGSSGSVSRETVEQQFREALGSVRRKELERGVTLVGPHRDDASFELNDLPVKGYASHGESWSFALSLRLGFARLLQQESPSGDPVIILDDVFAELDVRRRQALLSAVSAFEQVIVTAAVEEDVPTADWKRVVISAGAVVSESPAGSSVDSAPHIAPVSDSAPHIAPVSDSAPRVPSAVPESARARIDDPHGHVSGQEVSRES